MAFSLLDPLMRLYTATCFRALCSEVSFDFLRHTLGYMLLKQFTRAKACFWASSGSMYLPTGVDTARLYCLRSFLQTSLALIASTNRRYLNQRTPYCCSDISKFRFIISLPAPLNFHYRPSPDNGPDNPIPLPFALIVISEIIITMSC